MMLRFLAILLLLVTARAAELRFAGVVGNSGEAGDTLVRMDQRGERNDRYLGIGVVRDRWDTLWTRVGIDTVNRYALDGRLLETVRTPGGRISHLDALRQTDTHLVLFAGGKLYARPFDAPAGTAFAPVDIAVDVLGWGNGSRLPASREGHLLVVDPAAGTSADLGEHGVERIGGLAIGPGGDIFIASGPMVHRFAATGRPVTDGWPRRVSGQRESAPVGIVFVDGYWYGFGWHETIKRYDPDFVPDPGVVYGGNSGWFIGSVPEHGDIEHPQGVAALPDGLLAVSGNSGHVLLLTWLPEERRFDPVRRLGSLPLPGGLALANEGRLWFDGGQWEWTAEPGTPHRRNSPTVPGALGVLPGGEVVGVSIRHGRSQWMAGHLGNGLRQDSIELPEGAPQDPVAVVPLPENKPFASLLVAADGAAWIVKTGTDGRFHRFEGRLDLPVAEDTPYTDAVQPAPGALLAARDGAILHLRRQETGWTIADTWADFSGPLRLSFSENRLWVAERDRHQVRCFAWPERQLLATWGTADQPGPDIDTLDHPGAIAVRGRRAVVYDSGNQRLVKLEFIP